MTALAYIFPPISGLIAYLRGTSGRTRFHGLQAVLLGLLWPLSLLAGSLISPGVTQAAFAVMAVLWLVALFGTAIGRNPSLPGIRGVIANAAASSPREVA
jgi:uncharacterized membrane protein